jgi:hypothetical protein
MGLLSLLKESKQANISTESVHCDIEITHRCAVKRMSVTVDGVWIGDSIY